MNVNFCCALPVLKIVYHLMDLKDRNRGKHLSFLFSVSSSSFIIIKYQYFTGWQLEKLCAWRI